MKRLIDFDATPPIGTVIKHQRGFLVTLASVQDYRRKDGTWSVILTWVAPNRRIFTSGFKAKALTNCYATLP